MKKGIWKMFGVLGFVFLCVATLYYERTIQNMEDTLEKEVALQPVEENEFIPIKETEFSVAVEELPAVENQSEDAEWRIGEVLIEQEVDADDFMIVLEYGNVSKTPTAAICYTPDFSESYTANSINENMSGEIIFKPQTFTKGVWYVMLHGSGALGTYTAYGISGTEYDKIKNPVILKPRDLDATGALLPDE